MERGKLVERVKGVLMSPRTEWPVIAAEPETVKGLFTSYIVILAALPAIAGFIKGSLIGYGGFGVHMRTPFGLGIVHMILAYLLSLVVIYVVSLIVDALAPTFGGSKSPVQALKAAAYSWTAAWVAGVAIIIPWLGWLIALAGIVYALYLLYMGLPFTMKCPPEKSAGYTAVSFIIAFVLSWIVGALLAMIIGMGVGGAAMLGGATRVQTDDGTTVDANSALGRLTAASEQAKRMGKEKVEAIAPEQLKAFLPDSVAGMKRTALEASRQGAIGMQMSEATADYGDDPEHRVHLEIVDMGGARGMLAMASAMAPESERQTEHGYEKTYTASGRMINERWDSQSKDGEYGVMVGKRFHVKASGNADSIDQLKGVVTAVDLDKLEDLRNEGVSAK
jgi:hypothetical protein